jgi:hypothetical protein
MIRNLNRTVHDIGAGAYQRVGSACASAALPSLVELPTLRPYCARVGGVSHADTPTPRMQPSTHPLKYTVFSRLLAA